MGFKSSKFLISRELSKSTLKSGYSFSLTISLDLDKEGSFLTLLDFFSFDFLTLFLLLEESMLKDEYSTELFKTTTSFSQLLFFFHTSAKTRKLEQVCLRNNSNYD